MVIVSYPSELAFVYPRNRAGEPIAAAANRQVVAQSTLEDWLPDYRVVSSEGSVTEEGRILACDRVYVPSQFSGFGSLAVLTFDLDKSLTLGDGASTFAAGETIYASHQNLYVATNTWLPQPFVRQPRTAAGHRPALPHVAAQVLAHTRRAPPSTRRPAR